MPAISALERLRQEDGELQSNLGYIDRQTLCPNKTPTKTGRREGGREGGRVYQALPRSCEPHCAERIQGLLSLGERPPSLAMPLEASRFPALTCTPGFQYYEKFPRR